MPFCLDASTPCQRILVTGGAGFIGSNFIRHLLAEYPDCQVVNLDKLTYAGNLENLAEVADNPGYRFIQGDICDPKIVEEAMADAEAVVNFAAETHVDRSLLSASAFIETDVVGTHVLLEAARKLKLRRYLQISTDEVYGSIEQGSFSEDSPLHPSSPYSASKAAADLLVLSYYHTFSLPIVIVRSSNNYGPNQYPEKLIPLFVTNAFDNLPLPIYGDGLNVRDWLYVTDNCEAIDLVLRRGKEGEIYNIAGGCEKTNLEITETILELAGRTKELIRWVKDRPGHDRRYSLSAAKIASLGWRPKHTLEEGLRMTVDWYRNNEAWWRKIKSGEYGEYYRRQYEERLKKASSGE